MHTILFNLELNSETEDTQMLQNDLHKLYKWGDTNNMKFNGNKFEPLREQEIKSATTYIYNDSNIDDKENVSQRSRHNDE